MRFIMLASFVLSPLFAQAQEEPEANTAYPEQSEVDFVDPLGITGKNVHPGVGMIGARPPAKFFALFELRQDFRAEMNESVNEVR